MADNLLYYGDNLDILRRDVTDESVDLADLDHPLKGLIEWLNPQQI